MVDAAWARDGRSRGDNSFAVAGIFPSGSSAWMLHLRRMHLVPARPVSRGRQVLLGVRSSDRVQNLRLLRSVHQEPKPLHLPVWRKSMV